MTTINLDSRDSKANGTDYTTIWQALTGPVFRVVDEEGSNVADARVRHLLGKYWLYVDDTDGYQVMDQARVESLVLVAATERIGCE